MIWAVTENIVIYLCITAIILGIYAMGGGFWGFWSLALLGFINFGIKKDKPQTGQGPEE